jgi:hypothetical protein
MVHKKGVEDVAFEGGRVPPIKGDKPNAIKSRQTVFRP